MIPKSDDQPERMLQTINRPSRNQTQSLAFAWVDTRDTRQPGSRAYALLNDADRSIPDNSINAMRNYGIKPVLWSMREDALDELAA